MPVVWNNDKTVKLACINQEIELFRGNCAEPRDVGMAVKKLSVAFPKMTSDFWNLLAERMIAQGFSAEKIQFVVNKVIDEFHYKELNIADIMSINSKVKLLTGAEVYAKCGSFPHPDYKKINVGDKIFFVSIADALRYELPIEKL